VHRDERPERRFAALDLLARKRLADEVEARAAVLLRDDHAEDAELRHPCDRIHVELVLDVVLDCVWEDAVVDELADGVLQQSLLVGELEVHAAPSLRARWLQPSSPPPR
jgi:hypothetical protein